MKPVSIALKNWLIHHYDVPTTASDDELRRKAAEAVAKDRLSMDEFNRLVLGEPGENIKKFAGEIVKQTISAMNGGGANSMSTGNKAPSATVEDLFGNGSSGGNIRVKAGSERYNHTKSTAVNTKTGRPVYDERGRQASMPSEAEYAFAGVWLKETARRSGQIAISLNEHEKSLLEELYTKSTFCGQINGIWCDSIDGMQVKMLLNDVTSGGASVVPEFVDADLVTYPLLHGEIFPMVDLRPFNRGNSVEGGSVSNPSVTWGIGEGTSIGTFNTDAMIAAIETSIHPVTVAIEVGKDFMADAVADIGRILMTQIGERMSAELDRVVVVGNGTSEPEGIAVGSGLTDVGSYNGTAGPPVVDDYMNLIKGVGKQYRTAANRCCFISSDTTYFRSRGIKNDPASPSTDQRLVFGMDVQGYNTFGIPHKIQNNLANSKAIFGAMSRYRMYRRQGAETQWVEGGKELALRNQKLLIVRARLGGQVVDGNAFSISDDMQS